MWYKLDAAKYHKTEFLMVKSNLKGNMYSNYIGYFVIVTITCISKQYDYGTACTFKWLNVFVCAWVWNMWNIQEQCTHNNVGVIISAYPSYYQYLAQYA